MLKVTEADGGRSICLSIAVDKTVYIGRRSLNETSSSGAIPSSSFDLLASSSSPVCVLEFSRCGQYLAAGCDDKTVTVWKSPTWSLVASGSLPRRPTALTFSSDNQFLLSADKSGDVTRHMFTTDKLTPCDSPLLGHCSMILDMRLLTRQSDDHITSTFVATSDRDEKIRISHYPNSYNILSYCLGHKDFVSQLCVSLQYPHLLISGSGDNSVKVWDWYSGKLLDSVTLNDSSSSPNKEEELPAITNICCSFGAPPVALAVATERPGLIYLYGLSVDGLLGKSPLAITFTGMPLSCAFDACNNLWVLSTEGVACFSVSTAANKVDLMTDDPLHGLVKNTIVIKDLKPTDWSTLRKRDFDNITSYYAKKNERIKHKKMKLDPPAS